MIRYDGFYIATKKYLVVDTPVFDEIIEGIQILQFFSHEKQQGGSVSIAEFGVLEPHQILNFSHANSAMNFNLTSNISLNRREMTFYIRLVNQVNFLNGSIY